MALAITNSSVHTHTHLPLSQRSSARYPASRVAPRSPISALLLSVIRLKPAMQSKSGLLYRKLSAQASLCLLIAWCFEIQDHKDF